LFQHSCDTTITIELVFLDYYISDGVPKYFRQGLQLGWEALLHECVRVSPSQIQLKFFHLREAAQYQALPIPEAVPTSIIHFLLMLRCCREGQAAFLITPTEVMLFSPMLSSYVHINRLQMWAFVFGTVDLVGAQVEPHEGGKMDMGNILHNCCPVV
jgi:hypothetical protein